MPQEKPRLVDAALLKTLSNVEAIPCEALAQIRKTQFPVRAVGLETLGVSGEALERSVHRCSVGGVAESSAIQAQRNDHPQRLNDLDHQRFRLGIRFFSANSGAQKQARRTGQPQPTSRNGCSHSSPKIARDRSRHHTPSVTRDGPPRCEAVISQQIAFLRRSLRTS